MAFQGQSDVLSVEDRELMSEKVGIGWNWVIATSPAVTMNDSLLWTTHGIIPIFPHFGLLNYYEFSQTGLTNLRKELVEGWRSCFRLVRRVQYNQ